MELEISKEEINGIAVLALKGRLNVATTSELEAELKTLLDAGKQKIVLDCRRLEYISSAGLRVMLAYAKSFKKISGQVALSALSANVKQVFEISGFTSIFPIYSSLDEALKSM